MVRMNKSLTLSRMVSRMQDWLGQSDIPDHEITSAYIFHALGSKDWILRIEAGGIVESFNLTQVAFRYKNDVAKNDA